MRNPSWLKKLAPSELQLLRDLADVVKRTVLSDRQGIRLNTYLRRSAEIRQEIKQRAKNNLISDDDTGNARSRRG
jgi:hypothetical protein